jgi:hypothetical protein
LVKVLAKRKGIPEDEAKLLLESIKDDELQEIKESIAAIADMGRGPNASAGSAFSCPPHGSDAV